MATNLMTGRWKLFATQLLFILIFSDGVQEMSLKLKAYEIEKENHQKKKKKKKKKKNKKK